MMSKTVIAVVVAGMSLLSGSPRILAAGTNVYKDTIWIRDGGNNYNVEFSVAAGEMVWYPNGTACSTPHQTTKGATNRYYDHIHITYTLPKTGRDVASGASMTVTAAKIKAYWDWVYSGYTSTGTENVAQNCHGYAFGINTWIQNPSYIDADDYVSASGWSDTQVLRGQGNGHSIKVDKVTPGTFGSTVETSEKNGPSRIYKTSWGWQNPPGSSDKRKAKP